MLVDIEKKEQEPFELVLKDFLLFNLLRHDAAIYKDLVVALECIFEASTISKDLAPLLDRLY